MCSAYIWSSNSYHEKSNSTHKFHLLHEQKLPKCIVIYLSSLNNFLNQLNDQSYNMAFLIDKVHYKKFYSDPQLGTYLYLSFFRKFKNISSTYEQKTLAIICTVVLKC
jgi:hypothetical protein